MTQPMIGQLKDRKDWSALAVRAVAKSFEDTTGRHYSAIKNVSIDVKRSPTAE